MACWKHIDYFLFIKRNQTLDVCLCDMRHLRFSSGLESAKESQASEVKEEPCWPDLSALLSSISRRITYYFNQKPRFGATCNKRGFWLK